MKHLSTAIRGVGAWLGPRSQPYDLLRIYALSAAIGFFYLFFGNLGIENGAAHYTQWADAIVTGGSIKGNSAFYIRDVGMALVMLISGFPWTHSLVGLVVIQVAMGMTMPLFTYSMLRPWFPRAAYYTAIASTVSLAPFLLAKLIHHDQPYVFLLILSLWLLSLYVRRTRPSMLYILTMTVFGLSLVRQVGKGLYPLLMLIALIEGPRKYLKHIGACVLIFVACNYTYSIYRESVLGNLPALGIEAFENIYLNSSEFGVKLSPEFGPNVKFIIDRARECALPTPADAPKLKDGPSAPWFMAEHFYKYTADELVEKVFTQTHREYLYYLLGCIADDHATLDRIMLMAAVETALARPFFVLGYALRNSFQLLFDPGWLHGRHTTEPHFRGGLLFPYGGISTGNRGTIGDNLPNPAISEASFIPLPRQPQFIQELYFSFEMAWYRSYHPITVVVGCFMVLTWIATAIGLLQRMFKSSVILHRWSDRWLSHLVVPSSLGISAMLLANVGITGLFIDSYYRYDFSLLLLKFMLAGIGIAIFLNFLKPLAAVGAAFQRVPGGATLPPYHGWAVTAGQRVSVIAWTPVQATDRAIRRSWSRVRIELRDSAREWRTALGIVVVSLGGLALLIYAFWETDNAAQAPAATATSTRTAPPSPASQAPPVLDLPKTELADLPGLPAGQQWHLIWGLNAAPLQIAPVVAGQTALQLVATRTDERHAIAAHFRDPDASAPTTGYRFTVWLKAESAVNAQIMVRDPVNPQTGKPGKEREIRFDLASSSVLSANDNSATQTIVRDSRDWQKLQIDLPTAHREVFIYVGMLENGSNSHVFRGTGQRLIFGGFEISRR